MNLRPLPIAIAALICGGTLAMPAHGALIAYEGFSGLSTGGLNGQGSGTGWSGSWNDGGAGQPTMQYISSGLNYSKSGVSQLSTGGTAKDPTTDNTIYYSFRSLTSAVGGVGHDLWVSFLVNNTASVNTGKFFGFSLNSGSSEKVYTGQGNLEGDWLSVLEGTSNIVIATGDAIDVGNTHLIVYHLTFNSSSLTTENLYIDPVPSTGPSPTGYAAIASGTLASTFTVDGVRIGGNQAMLVDELRIGDTFQDVVIPVPEPASLGGLGLGGLILLRRKAGR